MNYDEYLDALTNSPLYVCRCFDSLDEVFLGPSFEWDGEWRCTECGEKPELNLVTEMLS